MRLYRGSVVSLNLRLSTIAEWVLGPTKLKLKQPAALTTIDLAIIVIAQSCQHSISHNRYHVPKQVIQFNIRSIWPTLRASNQDGLGLGFSGSIWYGCSSFFWKSMITQSMILMIRCGGLASLRTVAM